VNVSARVARNRPSGKRAFPGHESHLAWIQKLAPAQNDGARIQVREALQLGQDFFFVPEAVGNAGQAAEQLGVALIELGVDAADYSGRNSDGGHCGPLWEGRCRL